MDKDEEYNLLGYNAMSSFLIIIAANNVFTWDKVLTLCKFILLNKEYVGKKNS
jgi:hypothetical protein